MNINYQKKLDDVINNILIENNLHPPSLLLHSCCAPCSSYVLEYLAQYFKITVFYYNPNIFPETEYLRRKDEQISLIDKMLFKNKVDFIDADYDRSIFCNLIQGLEQQPEGSERCFKCYRLRMNKTAENAKLLHFDYFTTTLSISPHKNAQKLNEIGADLESLYHVKYLYADFKKKNGYKRSIELSNQYGLYRQDYCGCKPNS